MIYIYNLYVRTIKGLLLTNQDKFLRGIFPALNYLFKFISKSTKTASIDFIVDFEQIYVDRAMSLLWVVLYIIQWNHLCYTSWQLHVQS